MRDTPIIMLNNVGITGWFVIASNRLVVSKTGLAWLENNLQAKELLRQVD
jgi:hypothetical protein